MNKVIISGNLVKDMEVTTTKKTDIGNIVIANNRGYGDDQRTTFVRCSLFGKRVESMEEYLVKGAKVLITGTLDIVSKDIDGDYVNFTNILIDEIEILKFKDIEEDDEDDKKKRKKTGNRKGKK